MEFKLSSPAIRGVETARPGGHIQAPDVLAAEPSDALPIGRLR